MKEGIMMNKEAAQLMCSPFLSKNVDLIIDMSNIQLDSLNKMKKYYLINLEIMAAD